MIYMESIVTADAFFMKFLCSCSRIGIENLCANAHRKWAGGKACIRDEEPYSEP